MPREIYEVVAQGARYWFIFLMAIIVWRSYRWLARDRAHRRKRLRLLPDAGYIGEFVVRQGSSALPPGTALPIPREGVLGAVRGADLFVPVRGVFKKHLLLRYEDGIGLRARPFGRHPFEVDGVPFQFSNRKGFLMAHGSRLKVGEAELRLRMFAGFETARFRTEDTAPREDGAGDVAEQDEYEALSYGGDEVFLDEMDESSPAIFYPALESDPEEDILYEDGDLTDEAAPPKSLYVGPDEAERAKRVLWDRLLRGGDGR